MKADLSNTRSLDPKQLFATLQSIFPLFSKDGPGVQAEIEDETVADLSLPNNVFS